MSHNQRLRDLADNTQFNIQLDTGDRLKRRSDQTVPVYDKMLTASAGASQVYATDWTRQDDLGNPIAPGGTMVFRHTLGDSIFLANVNTYIGVIVDGRRTATLYTGAVRMDKNFIIVTCPGGQTYSHSIVDAGGGLQSSSNPLYEMSMRVVITSGPTIEDGEGLAHYQDIPARFTYTSGTGTFIVPADTTTLTMHAVGGGGAGYPSLNWVNNYAPDDANMNGKPSTITGPGVSITANGGTRAKAGGAGGSASGGDHNASGSGASGGGMSACSQATSLNHKYIVNQNVTGGTATLDQTAIDAKISSVGFRGFTCAASPYGIVYPSGYGAGGYPIRVNVSSTSYGNSSSWYNTEAKAGGGAGYARKTVSVTPGDQFAWSVGAGGSHTTTGVTSRAGTGGIIIFEWS